MSFPPLDPDSFCPVGTNHSSFRAPSVLHDLAPLTQPEPDPSIVMNIDNSVAIDRVCALLDMDFTESRAAWIHLLMSLVTDARNGLLSSIQNSSLSQFLNLSPSETTQITFLKWSIESLDTFFADTQDDPNDWITCMGCATTFQLPVGKDNWDAILSNCSGDITATRTCVVDEAVDAACLHIQAWVDGERISAQDAAIQRLMSDHAPDISEVISDPCLIEWSCRLLEAMKHHFTETLVTEASQILPTPLSDHLNAERQAKVDAACRDARAEAKRLYHAELTRLQSSALEEAAKDFEMWKSDMLLPEYQAKEASAKAEKLQELDAFKHGITIELEEHKENTCLIAAKSLVLSKTESRSCRKDRRADPTCASCSVSRAPSPSPSPSRKLDKTPTKVDFQVSSQNPPAPLCAPVSDHARGWAGPSVAQEDSTLVPHTCPVVPLAGPDIAKALVGTLRDANSGLPVTLTCCLPETLPAAAPLETVPPNNHVDIVMALAAPSGDARPSLARLVLSSPDIMTVAPDSSLAVPLVERYQSVTLSPSPASETMEECLVRLLGLQITASLAPIQSSVASISARLHTLEDGSAPWGADDNVSLGIGGYDKGYDYSIPSELPPGGEEHVDYHVESAPSHAAAKDAEMANARRRFESHDGNEDPHPYFKLVIMTTRNQTHDEIDPAHLPTLADVASEDWEDFTSVVRVDRLCIPPSAAVNDAFVHRTRIWLVKAQIEEDLKRSLCAECGSPMPPVGPSLTGPHLHPDDPSDPASVPTRLSEPISVSSDGSKISGFMESSPTPAPRTCPAGSALDLDTPLPGDGVGWSVMGGKCGCSFASIAAARPTAPSALPTLPPSLSAATSSFLTKPQLDSLTREQVINAFNARFSLKLGTQVPKDRAVAAFLNRASCPAPNPIQAPHPITKTEFTLVYDTRAGDLSAPSGRRGDAASYVCTIQKHIKDAGTKQAELIGGCWTSQTS